MEEHIVSIDISIDEKDIEFKITLKAALPILQTRIGGIDYSFKEIRNKAIFYASEKKLTKELGRRLRYATKRYKRIIALRDSGKTGTQEYNLLTNQK